MSRPLVVVDALLVNRRPTGVGRAILELTRELAREDRDLDFAVVVTEPAMFDHLEGKPGWRIVPWPGARGGTLRKAWFTQTALPRLCRELGADLLHSMHFIAPLRLGCPSVVTVCDLAWQVLPATIEHPRLDYYRLMVPPTLRRAAAVLAISEATAEDVRRLHPAAAQQVVVTPFGTPSWVWRAREAEVEAPPRVARFLFVGTLEPRKNLEGLMEAYAMGRDRIGDGFPGLLLVGGRGWKDTAMRRRMQDLRSSGFLEVRDYCSQQELWEMYRGSLALLFPSKYEGFGFPILEAMAAGLPVMTAERGAMGEFAGEAGLLVDPDEPELMAEGMIRLATDSELRDRMRTDGEVRAREWSWARTAAATLAVYELVLTESR